MPNCLYIRLSATAVMQLDASPAWADADTITCQRLAHLTTVLPWRLPRASMQSCRPHNHRLKAGSQHHIIALVYKLPCRAFGGWMLSSNHPNRLANK